MALLNPPELRPSVLLIILRYLAARRGQRDRISPDARRRPQLPPDHPVFMGSMTDGVKVETTEFRKFGTMQLKRRVTLPEISAIVSNGRTRILFSRWDICSGFLGTNTWGIVGYSPATSQALGRNILLYAANPESK